jgi:hypothetical protein
MKEQYEQIIVVPHVCCKHEPPEPITLRFDKECTCCKINKILIEQLMNILGATEETSG